MKIFKKVQRRPVVAIIPLIDILAILLIFFVSTSTFREQKPLFEVNLPAGDSLPVKDSQEARLGLSIQADGKMALGDQEVALENLVSALKELTRAQPEMKLELRADELAPFGTVVQVWNAMNQAGIPFKAAPVRIRKKTAP